MDFHGFPLWSHCGATVEPPVEGARSCPIGDIITSQSDCDEAHAALGLPRSTAWIGSSATIPRTCSWKGPRL